MPDIASLMLAGAANPWLYLPAAILLGALHALEPGHSKSLMAAFIIAVRGTRSQAFLLGLSAAIGHSLIVWALAMTGLWLGDKLILDRVEPWLVMVSGLLVIVLALRILRSIRRNVTSHEHDHDHDHDHSHDHHRKGETADTDAHAMAHAREIKARFAGRSNVSAGEVMWFGFTGGLLPCPASIAVLLVCLQLKKFTLGFAMVAAFSLGLAITLVGVGVAVAWGAGKASAGLPGFDKWSLRLPYISAGLVMVLGVATFIRGAMMA